MRILPVTHCVICRDEVNVRDDNQGSTHGLFRYCISRYVKRTRFHFEHASLLGYRIEGTVQGFEQPIEEVHMVCKKSLRPSTGFVLTHLRKNLTGLTRRRPSRKSDFIYAVQEYFEKLNMYQLLSAAPLNFLVLTEVGKLQFQKKKGHG